MVPFLCDICVFRRLTGRDYHLASGENDLLLLAAIRRVQLDAFWSRAPSTVSKNATRVSAAITFAETFRLKIPFGAPLKIPEGDHAGYFLAIFMVIKSMKPGRHSKNYQQWDTIRQLRSSFSIFETTLTHFEKDFHGVVSDKGMYLRFGAESTSSVWFSRFAIGCKNRMGQDWRPNRAISTDLILRMVEMATSKIAMAESFEVMADLITATTYFILCYVVSLRGPEGLLLNLQPLRDQPGLSQLAAQVDKQQRRPFFQVTLLGKIKGESHIADHVIPCVNTTSSGLPVKDWVDDLLKVRKHCGQTTGPAITHHDGSLMSSLDLDRILCDLLESVYDESQDLFPPDVKSREQISELFGTFRTLRKSSDSRAISQRVSKTDVMVVNRWSDKEQKQGKKHAQSKMDQYYADWAQILPSFLRYSFAM